MTQERTGFHTRPALPHGQAWQDKRARRKSGPEEGRYRHGDEPYGASEDPRRAHYVSSKGDHILEQKHKPDTGE